MHHKEWYSEASHMAMKVGISPSMPRLAGGQTLRNNIPSSDPESLSDLQISKTRPYWG